MLERTPQTLNLISWTRNLQKAALEPDQKLTMIKQQLIPKLLYGLQHQKMYGKTLAAADRIVKAAAKKALHLNIHTPYAALYASVKGSKSWN